MRTWILRGASLLLFAAIGPKQIRAEGPRSTDVHGTVNVLLANGNGLALVTDSNLTGADGRPAGEGPKLFVLNDHTICAIADFYSTDGPISQGKFPVYTNAPGIIAKLMATLSPNEKAEFKLDQLVNLYAYALSKLANLDAIRQQLQTPSGAELTIAGYENGKLHVSWSNLRPENVNGVWDFQVTDRHDQEVEEKLVTRFAGMDDIANSIMRNSHHGVLNDPILLYFEEQRALDQGKYLSVNDLRQIAVKIKTETSAAHHPLVGGKTQFVTMSNGKIDEQDVMPIENAKFCADAGVEASNVIIEGDVQLIGGHAPNCGLSGYLIGVTRIGGQEDIDGKAYIRSAFRDTVLRYRGAEPPFFDSQDIMDHTVLEVGESVSNDDHFLLQFRSEFPNVQVRRTH